MDLVATIAAVGGVVLLAWLNWAQFFPPPSHQLPEAPVSLDGATVRGDSAAPVVLIEYSDYMCPFCARFEEGALQEINGRYIETGQVQLAFRQHPIKRLHPDATKASEAALCAGRQEKFWEMHAALFREPKGLDESRLLTLAEELLIDRAEFAQCLAGEMSAQVQRDVEEANDLGLSGTPAFLVGRRLADGTVRVSGVVNGAVPFADFEKEIERALASSTSQSPTGIVVAAGGLGAMFVLLLWFRRNRSRQLV